MSEMGTNNIFLNIESSEQKRRKRYIEKTAIIFYKTYQFCKHSQLTAEKKAMEKQKKN